MNISLPTSKSAKHLSTSELTILLSDDNSSDEYRAAAQHLECCRACQIQLTTFAADANWWTDAIELLSGEQSSRWKPDLSHSSHLLLGTGEVREPISDQLLKMLGSPSHPEMLGRLGRYDIERVIGTGGMGVVLKAHDSELNRPIAIKLLAPHLSHVGAARERFAREGRAAAAVVHEHVVAIYNVESEDTLPFLTMQYVPGRSLQARVDENGPLGVEEILRIGMQAAAGLAAAHAQGLVHRDVKPSNILLEDTVERAVLTDFGLARAMDDASLTQTGIIAGTPHYMSPEQATGDDIDPRSDLFSLGSVLYFMATGHPPFRAANALAVLHRICQSKHRPAWQANKNLPDGLCDIIDRLLEKKPGRRFPCAEEVRGKLAALLSHVQQHGLGRHSWGGRRKRQRRRVLAILAVVSCALVGAGVYWLGTGEQTRETGPSLQPEVGAAIAAEGREFTGSLNDVKVTLSHAERETFYIRGGDEDWSREIESLQQDLDKFKSTIIYNLSDGSLKCDVP